MALQKRPEQWQALVPATLTARETRSVLWGAANRALAEWGPTDPRRQYLAVYLGHLFDAAARQEARDTEFMSAFPGESEPRTSLWVLAQGPRHEMRANYGDPEMQDLPSDLTPYRPSRGLEAAELSTETMHEFRYYMGAELIGNEQE